MIAIRASLIAALCLVPPAAYAQAQYPAANGSIVPSTIPMCISGGKAVPCGSNGQPSYGYKTQCDEPTDTTGTLTNINDTLVATNLDGFATTLLSLRGTYGGATVKFQFSDDGGTTWFDVLGNKNEAAGRESTSVLVDNSSRSWTINPGPGADSMRVVLTAISTGSLSAHFSINSCPTTNGVTASSDPNTATSALASEYPFGATPVTAAGSGATGAVVGTLAATAGKTNYICGFDVSAIGGTAAVGPIVVAGLISGSFTYQLASLVAGNLLGRTFKPCIPASGANTAITVTTTADGTASAVNVNIAGFRQ